MPGIAFSLGKQRAAQRRGFEARLLPRAPGANCALKDSVSPSISEEISAPASRLGERPAHGGDSDPRPPTPALAVLSHPPRRPPALATPTHPPRSPHPRPPRRPPPSPSPPTLPDAPPRPPRRPPRPPARTRPDQPVPNRYPPPARRSPPSGPAAGPASPRARAPRPAAPAGPAPPPAAAVSQWPRRLSPLVAGSAPRPPTALPTGRRCHGNRACTLCACPAAPRPAHAACGNLRGKAAARGAGPGGA